MTDIAQLFSDLVRAETRLYNAVDDRLRHAHGLSLGQYELMTIIDSRDDCRIYDIVREIAITVGAASKAVDRLERAAWCRRVAHPTDGRSSLLRLTPAGSRMLTKARPTFTYELTERLGGISARALAQTADTLATLRGSLEDHQLD